MGYDLARRWLATGGREGIPVVQLGRRLLVPKRQLSRFLDAAPPPAHGSSRHARKLPQPVRTSTDTAPTVPPVPASQYSLLDPDQPAST